MSIDMSQFYQVFFEEAAELLAEMEKLLLSLDVNSPSLDEINGIFRVAHSIKGGSATLGFGDMAEVTHVLETLLDKLRREELQLRNEMVDAFLRAGDVIKAQLAAHQGGDAVDRAEIEEICELLKRLANPGEAPAPQAPEPPKAAVSAPRPSAAKVLNIEFRYEPPAGHKSDLDQLLANLAALGNLEMVSAPSSLSDEYCRQLVASLGLAFAPGPESRKEGAPDAYRLRLSTSAAEKDVLEAMSFFVQPGQVRMQVEGGTAAPPPEKKAEAQEADPGYGFFVDVEKIKENQPAKAEPQPYGRRSTDDPNLTAGKSGRRDNDKQVVSAQGDTSSIRVSVEKVDQLINLVGELVITQAMLAQMASQVDPATYERLLNGLSQLERNTRDLQESVMSIRMLPIGFVFSRYPRVVRDLAGKLKKQVELKTIGEGTELDKGLIEKIADPLTHLVRNSLDHGIEIPEKRIAAGKDPTGTITLRASHQGGNIVIEVADDGAGLNREKILAKARERGLPVDDAMPDQEVFQLIFAAGFSTAEVVTDVSGRGVGMDVVRRNIESLGGRVEIDSALGVGTRMTVRLPLTLAILDGMSIAVGKEIFILPLSAIIESLQPAVDDIKTVAGEGGRVVHVRGEYLPLMAMHELFHVEAKYTDPHQGILVILETDSNKVALFVDELVGQHQVVIKSLESNYRRVPGVSGATIMGDGKVALILDVAGLVRMSQNR